MSQPINGNSIAATVRLVSAGYLRTRERDGCARCRHSEVEAGDSRKGYYCVTMRAVVDANGYCRDFVRFDTQQQDLPFVQSVLREIEAVIGAACTFQLVRRWGGRDLQIPVSVDAHHPLALTLGLEIAHRLVRAFAGQRLQLPLEANAMRHRRDAAIRQDRERGVSEEQCAVTYGLTRQAIRVIMIKGVKETAE